MNATKKITVLCNILLLVAAVIWGINFVFSKNAAEVIGPFTFMGVRYFLGATTILPFVLFLEKRKPPAERAHYDRKAFLAIVRVAAVMGLVQLCCSVLGQWGLGYTNASKAAFLTATYVATVPLLGFILFRTKTTLNMWIGVLLTLFGLYNLCDVGSIGLSINPGDIMIIVSAFFAAAHMLLISKYVQSINGMHLICVEFYIASFYCAIFALILEKPALSDILSCSTEILYASVLGSGICYMFQVVAQKYTDPTIAALLMSLESVFGALAGVIILGETFTFKEILGSVCIFAAVILAQLKPNFIVLRVRRKAEPPAGGSAAASVAAEVVESVAAEVAASVAAEVATDAAGAVAAGAENSEKA